MEDPECAVFRAEPRQVFYKRMFSPDEAADLLGLAVASCPAVEGAGGGVAGGERRRYELDLAAAEFAHVRERLRCVLSDYLPDATIGDSARVYRHTAGGVRPHTDASLDGRATYTLLLYLSDDFEGGRLSVRVTRSEEERRASEPGHGHKVFVFRPMCGYGLVFHKGLLHWADDVVGGSKDLLVADVASAF